MQACKFKPSLWFLKFYGWMLFIFSCWFQKLSDFSLYRKKIFCLSKIRTKTGNIPTVRWASVKLKHEGRSGVIYWIMYLCNRIYSFLRGSYNFWICCSLKLSCKNLENIYSFSALKCFLYLISYVPIFIYKTHRTKFYPLLKLESIC